MKKRRKKRVFEKYIWIKAGIVAALLLCLFGMLFMPNGAVGVLDGHTEGKAQGEIDAGVNQGVDTDTTMEKSLEEQNQEQSIKQSGAELEDVERDLYYEIPLYGDFLESNMAGEFVDYRGEGIALSIPQNYEFILHSQVGSSQCWRFRENNGNSLFYIAEAAIDEDTCLDSYMNLRAFINVYDVLNFYYKGNMYCAYYKGQTGCTGFTTFVNGKEYVYSLRFETKDADTDIMTYQKEIEGLSHVVFIKAGEENHDSKNESV